MFVNIQAYLHIFYINNMNKNLLTSYSFLAALSENDSDIYKTVYLPLFKRSISLFAKTNTSGTDIDIQEIVEEKYGITVPILIVQKLIKRVANDLSRRERSLSEFKIFENGKSFQFKRFEFYETEVCYERERRNTNALQEAFEQYIQVECNSSDGNIPSFSSFIDRNKKRLSSFFSGRVLSVNGEDVNTSFMPHVNFLQKIESSHHKLYKTAEQIYLGSIIASYLESGMNLDAKVKDGITYYLDTRIILEALDLQNAEDTQPTQELLKLIRNTGGKLRALEITINEIHNILEASIFNYSKVTPTSTINEACIRIGKNKTWLINISGKLSQYIKEELKLDIDAISENKINDYVSTEDVKLLEETRIKKKTAVHDVVSYLNIRDRRGENVRIFQKAKYWFITANKTLCNFNISRKTNGYISETIMPDELTSLLFLKNPKQLSKTVTKIGLNELIAQTLSEEYASKELINEFDIAVKTNTQLSSEDYETLLSSVAKQSTSKIQNILKDSDNKVVFDRSLHKLIDNERNNKSQRKIEKTRSKEKEKQLIDKNEELEKRLSEIEDKIIKNSKEHVRDKENQKEENENLKEQIRELKDREKIRQQSKKRIFKGLTAVIISSAGFLLIYLFPDVINWIRKSIGVIASLGGLWGLISLIFNVYKIVMK